jgi:hypothetical protein
VAFVASCCNAETGLGHHAPPSEHNKFRSIQIGSKMISDKFRRVQRCSNWFRSVQIIQDQVREVQIGADQFRSIHTSLDQFRSFVQLNPVQIISHNFSLCQFGSVYIIIIHLDHKLRSSEISIDQFMPV